MEEITQTKQAPTPAQCARAGKFSGILGIALNVLLATAKMVFGAVSGAVSVLVFAAVIVLGRMGW